LETVAEAIPEPRAVRVHGLDDALAALQAAAALGRPVILASIPGAAGSVGALWFRELVAAARARHPDAVVTAVLDCADQPGDALGALRAGIADIALAAPPEMLARLRTIAAECGGRIHPSPLPALDLRGRRDPVRACRDWLAG